MIVSYHLDKMKLGPEAMPIKTDRGWINIFHGVFNTMDGAISKLGIALRDMESPGRALDVVDD